MRRLSLMLLPVTLCATTAIAQTIDLPVQNNVLAINPFGFLFESYNIEYERAFSSTATWSVGVGNVHIGDDDDETYGYPTFRLSIGYAF